jgi:hypothetical protein
VRQPPRPQPTGTRPSTRPRSPGRPGGPARGRRVAPLSRPPRGPTRPAPRPCSRPAPRQGIRPTASSSGLPRRRDRPPRDGRGGPAWDLDRCPVVLGFRGYKACGPGGSGLREVVGPGQRRLPPIAQAVADRLGDLPSGSPARFAARVAGGKAPHLEAHHSGPGRAHSGVRGLAGEPWRSKACLACPMGSFGAPARAVGFVRRVRLRLPHGNISPHRWTKGGRRVRSALPGAIGTAIGFIRSRPVCPIPDTPAPGRAGLASLGAWAWTTGAPLGFVRHRGREGSGRAGATRARGRRIAKELPDIIVIEAAPVLSRRFSHRWDRSRSRSDQSRLTLAPAVL